MCQIYASTEPTRYDSEARSLRIQGSVTSIRLEKEFWSILEEMAEEAESSTPELINTLYTEVHQNFGEVRNEQRSGIFSPGYGFSRISIRLLNGSKN